MTTKELLALGSSKIRSNEVYLKQFIDAFKKEFNYVPKCTGCSFKNDYNNLNLKINGAEMLTNYGKMEKYQIKRNRRSIIHTYLDENGKAKRSYGKNMTDEFAELYLKNGTKAEIEERKTYFDVIPTPVKKKSVKRKAKK